MANIFPRFSNWLPIKILVCITIIAASVVSGMAYYFTPKYTRVGYQPTQPVAFDHSLHVNQLGMDCRYCHTGVEKSSHSNVPSTQTCMNCHTQIKSQSPKLSAVRESWKTGNPVPWVRIHKAPDYVYFNHAVHVNRGVSCVACHGHVNPTAWAGAWNVTVLPKIIFARWIRSPIWIGNPLRVQRNVN